MVLGSVGTTAAARGSDAEVRAALTQSIAALQALKEAQRSCEDGQAELEKLKPDGLGASRALDSAVADFLAVEAHCSAVDPARERLRLAKRELSRVMAVAPTDAMRQQAAQGSAPALVERLVSAQKDAVKSKALGAKALASTEVAQQQALAAYVDPAIDAASKHDALAGASRGIGHAEKVTAEMKNLDKVGVEARLSAAQLATCSLSTKSWEECASVADPSQVGDAIARMADSAMELRKRADLARLEAFGVTAELQSQSSEAKLLAVRYLSFLDRNPGAKGLFGASAFSFAANSEGGEAAVRLAFGPHASKLIWDSAVIVSGPLSKEGPTSIYGSAPPLRKSPALTLLANFRNSTALTSAKDQYNLLYKIGLNARVQELGYAHFSGAGPWTSVQTRVRPWSVGTQMVGAYARQDEEALASWQINLDRKVLWEPATAQIRCPVPSATATFVTCENGAFSPPAQRTVWSLSGEYRREFEVKGLAFGLVPRLGIDRDRRLKKDRAELPVYFIPNTAEKAKLTGGISYAWERVRKPEESPEAKINRTFSLFVNVPLEMLIP
jgi:hypothetical protein